MGMDVYGNKPKNKKGEYFRNNCWYWRPLWMYCERVAPELCAKVKYAHSNDGDGLNAADSKALAKILKEKLSSGDTENFEKQWKKEQEESPEETCTHCGGTGSRTDAVGKQMGFHDKWNEHKQAYGWCNACDGKGTKKSMSTWYGFEAENVKEFALFLENCGGFKIC